MGGTAAKVRTSKAQSVYVCIYVYVGRRGRNMNGRAKERRAREREEGKGERANEERKMPDEGIDETKDGTYERDA